MRESKTYLVLDSSRESIPIGRAIGENVFEDVALKPLHLGTGTML
jgi:hypothetical protein